VLSAGAQLRIRQETALQRERGKAIHASKLSQIGELAGGIAHEINTPLTVIMGHSERIDKANRSNGKNERIVASTENIENNCLRIHRIVQGLKRFSRDGSADPIENVGVASVVANVESLCLHKLKTAGVELEVKAIDPELTVLCRAVELEQVLVNLISNAIDAVEEAKLKKVSLEVVDQGETVRFIVTDTGPGVAKEHQRRLFHPFFTTKKMGKGTGLGLAISRDIVEVHGGKIWYDPSTSQSSFFVELPT
jgi:C4-dicarboxylate-specific signal transduction histidine kinase